MVDQVRRPHVRRSRSWDLSSEEIARWGQQATPFRAAAIFPPDVEPESSAAALQKASISYLDALGREVNLAQPGGRIATVDLDKYGNVTRSLSPQARHDALQEPNTVLAANLKASHTTYETTLDDGREFSRPVRAVGPERDVDLGTTTVRG